MTEDLYKILGIDKTAQKDDIKKAYRLLAIKNHPDKGGDAEQFKKIVFAYSILSDPEKRKKYDSGDNNFDNVRTIKDEAQNGLLGLFHRMLQNVDEFNSKSMIEAMNLAINNVILQCKAENKKSKKQIKQLTKNLKRIIRKDKNPNVFESLTASIIKSQKENRIKVARNLKIAKESLRILKEYEEDQSLFDKEIPSYQTFTMTSW